MSALHLFDIFAAVYGSLMGASNLLQARRCVARRSSADVSLTTVMVMLFGCGMWLTYGVLHAQPTVIVANTVGTLSFLAVAVVVVRFRARPAPSAD